MADMKTLTLGGKTFNIMDAEARAKAIPTVQVGGDTLTWDGNTEGKVSSLGIPLYKVSDAIPNKEDFANGAIVNLGEGEIPLDSESAQGVFMDDGFALMDVLAIVPYNGYDIDGLVFPEAGVYFISSDGTYVSYLTIPGYTGFGSPKIDPAYLYQPDWNQNDETAPDFIKNRPFGESEVVIVAEQTITPGEGAPAVANAEYLPTVGTVAVVNFNGNPYNCEVQEKDGIIVFGNLSMAGIGEDTGEPFVVAMMGLMANIIFSGESAIIKIVGTATKKLPPKFYDGYAMFYYTGEPGGYYIYSDATYSTKATKAEIQAAIANRPIMICHMGLVYYTPVYIDFIEDYCYMAVALYFQPSTGAVGYAPAYTAEYVPPTT